MGTFDVHENLHELDSLRGPDGLAATGLFLRTGIWTSSHGRTGIIPLNVVEKMSGGDLDSIERLIDAGLWKKEPEGYRMLRGPHADPDLPMPLWRYSDSELDGRIFEIDDTPNN